MTKDHYSKEILKKGGIYQITNIINGKSYIGSTSSKNGFAGRYGSHFNELNKNKHKNKHLQSAWNKYGADNFEWRIVEFVTRPEGFTYKQFDSYLRKDREQFYIDYFDSFENGYNNMVPTVLSQFKNKNIDRSFQHKKCIVYTLDGVFVSVFDSLNSAYSFVGGKSDGSLSSVIKSKTGKYKKYIIKPYVNNYKIKIDAYVKPNPRGWRTKDRIRKPHSEATKKKITISRKTMAIVVLNEKGVLTDQFQSIKSAIEEYGSCVNVSLKSGKFIKNKIFGRIKFMHNNDFISFESFSVKEKAQYLSNAMKMSYILSPIVLINEDSVVINEFVSANAATDIYKGSVYRSLNNNAFIKNKKIGVVKFMYKSDYENMIGIKAA